MQTTPLSRGGRFAASPSIPSNRTIGSNGSSNGSIERSVPYQPQFCERTIGKGAAARTATIVYQQLRYWSSKGQHQFEEEGVVKVWFYKKAEELSSELQMSVPTIRRALKRLLDLGLLVTRQWWKHRYFRTNFFHLPLEPATIQRDAAATATKNKVVRGRRAGVSTTVSSPANQSPRAHKTHQKHSELSSPPERTSRSDQNDTHIQKKTSIEEITYKLAQPHLWRKSKPPTEECSICSGTGTIERHNGNMMSIHKCSCSAGNRYSHLPVLVE